MLIAHLSILRLAIGLLLWVLWLSVGLLLRILWLLAILSLTVLLRLLCIRSLLGIRCIWCLAGLSLHWRCCRKRGAASGAEIRAGRILVPAIGAKAGCRCC